MPHEEVRVANDANGAGSGVSRGKRLWSEESRPARAACLYVMRSAHGPDKSGETLSERPFPASEASISRSRSTLSQIPNYIVTNKIK
jgi:hypothetical protein